MSRRLIVQPEAESEMADAAAWYEERRPGLGAEFRLSVEAGFAAIKRNPMAFPVVYNSVRRALIRRFPYKILYVFDDARIEVLAVFHTKRDPTQWQTRV